VDSYSSTVPIDLKRCPAAKRIYNRAKLPLCVSLIDGRSRSAIRDAINVSSRVIAKSDARLIRVCDRLEPVLIVIPERVCEETRLGYLGDVAPSITNKLESPSARLYDGHEAPLPVILELALSSGRQRKRFGKTVLTKSDVGSKPSRVCRDDPASRSIELRLELSRAQSA
jgi:hypothetical protein